MLLSGFVLTVLFFASGCALLFITVIRWANEPVLKRWLARLLLSAIVGLCGFCLTMCSYWFAGWWNTFFQPLLIDLACVGLLLSLIVWGFAPKRLPARLVLSSFVGLGVLCLTVGANQVIGLWDWWDGLFRFYFLRFVTNAALSSGFEAAHHPIVYLFGAWALGFVVTFHLLGRIDQPDRTDDSEQ